MRKLYLYKKFYEGGVSVRNMAQHLFHKKEDEINVISDYARKETALTKALDTASAGDIFIIDSLCDLGQTDQEIIRRLRCFMNKRICLIICAVKSTYEKGIDETINGVVLATILEMLSSAHSSESRIIRSRRNIGRPVVEFPDGWDEMFQNWKSGKVSSADFMQWSGMKKATFYNKITEYKNLLLQEEDFKNSLRSSQQQRIGILD